MNVSLLRLALGLLFNPKPGIKDFESPLRLMRALSHLGAEGSLPVPPELLPMGARVLAQGYLNRVALPLLGGWLLPRWMREQSDPASPLFVPRSVSNLMLNQTDRSWTALGLPGEDHPVECMVDRWGLLTPVPGGPSLDWWVEVEGSGMNCMAPGTQPAVTQRLQSALPCVVTAYEGGGLRVSSEVWMLPLPRGDWAAMQVVLFNIADMPLRGTFRFALRPYNPEALSPIYHIAYDGTTFRADGRPGPLTWPRPEGWRLSDLRSGDLFRCPQSANSGAREIRDPQGFAHGVLEYSFSVAPWEEAEFLAFMPVHPRQENVRPVARKLFSTPQLDPQVTSQWVTDDGQGARDNSQRSKRPGGTRTFKRSMPLPHPEAYSRAKAATMLGWRTLLDEGVRVSLPDGDLQESWEANHLHLLALHDGGSITPGPDLYHSLWLRDAAYMAYTLSTHGYVEAANQLLRGFLARRRKDGSFVSQSGEWDSTGQVLWVLWQHMALHPGALAFQEVLPSVERGAYWIARTLERCGGLMPPGIAAEHLGPPDRYYWDNLWSLAGLVAAGQLTGSRRFAGTAARLRKTLDEAFDADAQRLGGALPAAPGRRVDLGAVGTLIAWYPLGLLPSDSPYLAATLRALEETTFYEGALFVNTGHSGWGTYLNMRIAGCYLLVDSRRGWELIRWLLRHASPTYNWPEAISAQSGSGSTGDGHHGWASAEWLLLVRAILLREEEERLTITPALPEEWLASPGEIKVEAAPTQFGHLSYRIRWQEREIELLLDCSDFDTLPPEVWWNLPVPVESVGTAGSPAPTRGNSVLVPHGTKRVSVVRRDNWRSNL